MVDASAVYGGGPVDVPSGVVAEVVRMAVARSSPAEALQAVIEMAVQTGPCDAVSISLLAADRSVDTVAYSDDRVLKADRLQYEFGAGPCVDAVWTDGVFIVPDLAGDDRWPRWASEASELGIGASLSVHLFTDSTLGSINLYSVTPREFTETDVENARVIAAQASVVLAYERQNENLWRAIDSRNLIGQAQGILMERYGLTGPKAFAVLRRYSQERNVKMRVLAEELASTRELPGLGRGQQADDDPGT
jgi:GAF domain-containing protein